jgi:hypothetical protein
MAYVDQYDCESYARERLRSAPAFELTTTDERVAERLWKRFNDGGRMGVNLPQWRGKAYVIAFRRAEPVTGVSEVTATLKPTGAPGRCASDALTLPANLERYSPSILRDAINRSEQMLGRIMRTEALRAANEARMRAPVDTGALRASLDIPRLWNVPFTKKEEPVLKKVRNKFYVAADSVTRHSEQGQDNAYAAGQTSGARPWTKKSLDDAIKQAGDILEAEPSRDHVAIVRIIRIVRRKKSPLVVEKVA